MGRIVGRLEALSRFPALKSEIWSKVDRRFPVLLTRSWLERVRQVDGPLGLQAFPSPSELKDYDGDSWDPVGEKGKTDLGWVVQKHPDRALLLVTKRCHLYCRYCFRRVDEGAQDPTAEELDTAIDHLNRLELNEVILSGGDPLALSNRQLFSIIDRLDAPVIRIHTRAPITAPHRVDDGLVSGLSDRIRSGLSIWLIVHCNHPRELSVDVQSAISSLRRSGLPMLNQSVLLRGVNDDLDVLESLCKRLVEIGVFPYYLHHTDAAAGNGLFRVELEKGLDLYRQLERRISGIALPRYVIDPPDGSGKVDVTSYLGVLNGQKKSHSKV
jgi:lysine 2,3-aminomutase